MQPLLPRGAQEVFSAAEGQSMRDCWDAVLTWERLALPHLEQSPLASGRAVTALISLMFVWGKRFQTNKKPDQTPPGELVIFVVAVNTHTSNLEQ